ncbi:MAG: D-alanine--D-alanine ligase [Leptospirales bacterium]|nr:D-alanine--D-alanine ligase [Leptospirales bacterium]
MINIGILYGGKSGEHDVSLCSAASVVSGLDKDKYNITAIGVAQDGRWHVQDRPIILDDPTFGKILKLEKNGDWLANHYGDGKLTLTEIKTGRSISLDIVFPVMHGTNCEDGRLQGMLELSSVPYIGAEVAGSAIGMDKDISKRLVKERGISVVPWETLTYNEWKNNKTALAERLIEKIGLPLFTKPCNTGSSVGVNKVKTRDDFSAAVESSFRFDNKLLIEKALSVREIECAVLGNENPQTSSLGEIIPRHEFYSYEAKYIDSDGAELVIPAQLEPQLEKNIRDAAVKVFIALNCAGFARVDFFVDKQTNELYFNEINTIPGFTSISMFPKLWEHAGLAYEELLDRLVSLALERHSQKKRITTEFTND